jgi:hypothetical protein
MNGSLIAVVCQKIRRFFEAETTQRAAGIHVPLPGRVLGLFAQFVGHTSSKLRMTLKKIDSGRALNDPGSSFIAATFSWCAGCECYREIDLSFEGVNANNEHR